MLLLMMMCGSGGGDGHNVDAGGAILTACCVAVMGPVPMTAGSTPTCAQDTMRAKGATPRLAAFANCISTTAAAPSFIPEELPAVTVPDPSRTKQGLSLDRPSIVVPCRGNSSSVTTVLAENQKPM